MTRKHFQSLAKGLASQRPWTPPTTKSVHNQAMLKLWIHCCYEVACACKTHNGGFNFDRFYDACGMTPEDRNSL